jgi:hypothetical protein
MSAERSMLETRLHAAKNQLAAMEQQRAMGDASFALAQAVGVTLDEIKDFTAQLVKIDDRSNETAEDRAEARRLESYRAAREDAAFWLRRFCTTLGIGNAAAFAAVASGFLQSDEDSWSRIASPVADALTRFSTGMVLAGAMPVFLMLFAQIEIARALSLNLNARGADAMQVFFGGILIVLAVSSGGCLFYGFGYAIGGVRGLIAH